MSSGITIFPKIKDFEEQNLTAEQLDINIDNETRFMANKFNELRALALCTPKNTFESDPYNNIKKLVDCYINAYIKSYKTRFTLIKLLDLKTQNEFITEDSLSKDSCLYFYDYHYSYLGEIGHYLNEDYINLLKIKSSILGICLATPIDITPRDQVQYSDGHEEPVYYLASEMNNLEESLDECLESICISEWIIKYWDGHKEG